MYPGQLPEAQGTSAVPHRSKLCKVFFTTERGSTRRYYLVYYLAEMLPCSRCSCSESYQTPAAAVPRIRRTVARAKRLRVGPVGRVCVANNSIVIPNFVERAPVAESSLSNGVPRSLKLFSLFFAAGTPRKSTSLSPDPFRCVLTFAAGTIQFASHLACHPKPRSRPCSVESFL
jgi:hypothetical protein